MAAHVTDDLTGRRYGQLTVTGRSTDNIQWDLSCDCGKQTQLRTKEFTQARVVTCGDSIHRTGNSTNTLYTYKKVCIAYKMRAAGKNYTNIAVALGVSRCTVTRWLRDEIKYSPHIDDIAVMRAVEGDPEVWVHLTVWERKIVLAKLRVVRSRLTEGEWNAFVGEFCRGIGITVDGLTKAMRTEPWDATNLPSS